MGKLHLSTYYALGSLTMCGMHFVSTVCIRRAPAPFQCHHEDEDDGIHIPDAVPSDDAKEALKAAEFQAPD